MNARGRSIRRSSYQHIKITFDPDALTQVVRWLQRELNVTGARTNP